jgi:adenylate cyclase
MPGPAITGGQRSFLTQAALVVAVVVAVAAVTQEPALRLGIIQRLELAAIDYRFISRGIVSIPRSSSNVVIVEIAQDSFESMPERFPWPRSYYAHLLHNLKQAGARVVAFDLIFNGTDNYAAMNDSLFRAAIRESGITVLAGKREQDSEDFVVTSSRENFGNMFFGADSALGLVNIRPDDDGVYRFYNTSFVIDTARGEGFSVPTLAFAALNKFFDMPPMTVPGSEGRGFHYAGRIIPAYDPGAMLINFYGPNGTLPRVKIQDVLDDETFTTTEEASSGEQINTFNDPEFGLLHDGTFLNKIVLVGVTVPEYKDLFPVSMGRAHQRGDNLMYGVEIHANVIENVLRSDFIRMQSPVSEVLMVLLLVALAFVVTSLIKGLKTRYHFLLEVGGFLFVGLATALTVVVATLLFVRMNYLLSITPAFLALAGGYLTSTTYHFVTERKQRLQIKSMFSTYVHPSLVEELVDHPERLVLGGKREELTVLFSDIEGFTGISQNLEPEKLVGLLNEYLSVMSDVIFRSRGTLDKYVGDAIMAFWGAPIPQGDHAMLACTSALQMRDALTDLNRIWAQQGKPKLAIRMGLNTGPMVVGNMGATGKFAYTVIGDSVNLASRLEGANKEYRTCIMASEQTYTLVKEKILGRKLDRIAVKGRSEAVTTYELIQMRERPVEAAYVQFLELYEEGMTLYFNRKWADAQRVLQKALELRPGDVPAALHRERARAFEATPPPDSWDGVFVMTRK